MVPDELHYTEQHEWVERTGADTVRVGITDYAQSQLGDVVFVQLPDVGQVVAPDNPVGEVESTKSVSDVYAPLAGEVVARNEDLDSSPELVNSDPYGAGWMMEVRLDDPASVDSLMNAGDYRTVIAEA